MSEEQKTIKEILTEAMDLRDLNFAAIADLTDIQERYVRAIIEEDVKNLPSSPYIRGYLMKICSVLNIDGSELWKIYREEYKVKTSGREDKLPQNRFAFKKMKKRNVVFAIIAVFVIIYIIFRASQFFGSSRLEINNPPTDNFLTNSPTIELRGQIDPQDKLTINNEEVAADGNGYFQKEFLLEKGINSIDFIAKRLLGKEIKITRKVIYQ